MVSITENQKFKVGWQVGLDFKISLRDKDIVLLEDIKNYFRIGSIYYKKKYKIVYFRVQSVKELKIIIDHFDKYPFITHKWADF